MPDVDVTEPVHTDAFRRWVLAPDRRASRIGIGLAMALGLAIRLVYIKVHRQDIGNVSDPYYYHGGANLLAAGQGFPDPFQLAVEGRMLPGAYHPPGYLLTLALASVAGFKSLLAHQTWSALLGTATIGVVGLAARRLAGPRAAIIAAFIAAVYPNFWFSDGLVMSETLVLLAMASTFVLAYRFLERPAVGRAIALGVAIGVTALTRSEALLLLVLLGVPLVLSLKGDGIGWRRRAGLLAVTGATTVALISPWVLYNLSRFEKPVYLSVSDHTLLAGNCPDVYRGGLAGFWTVSCILDLNCPDLADRRTRRWFVRCLIKVDPKGDASTTEARFRAAAMSNIGANLGSLPFVVFAREGRAWGFYKPSQGIILDSLSTREPELSRLALAMYYALAAGTVVGTVVLRRRRIPVLPLLAPIIGVTLTVSVTFGETRYRALAEVSLVLLSAVAVDAALRALSRRRAQGSDHGDRLTTGRQGGGAQRDSNPNVLAESGG